MLYGNGITSDIEYKYDENHKVACIVLYLSAYGREQAMA